MKLRVLVNCIADQRPVSAGDVIDVSPEIAVQLLQTRRAEVVEPESEQAVVAAPETAQAQPARRKQR